ncbi:MAG: hypothetical protein QNK37_29920 [Acidobacteriota bacterium]|nr:hypothetical protein [Acidobacteriota bacterium]
MRRSIFFLPFNELTTPCALICRAAFPMVHGIRIMLYELIFDCRPEARGAFFGLSLVVPTNSGSKNSFSFLEVEKSGAKNQSSFLDPEKSGAKNENYFFAHRKVM